MTLFHGSPIGGLTELQPFLSEHGQPYLYFATNPLVALLYAEKPVPKPFSFYPYGFDKDGTVVYSEYFENAFYDLYHGKVGYLYECDNVTDLENPTQINCAYTTTEPVKIDRVTQIDDLYAYFTQQAEQGLFRVKRRAEISEREMGFVLGEFQNDIKDFDLKRDPQCEMSRFIQRHFPAAWNADKD